MASGRVKGLLEQEGKARSLIKENRRHGKIYRQAAEEGDLNTVKFFLAAPHYLKLSRLEKKRCTNHGSADENGTTPLHLAASNGHFMIVKAILSSEGRVDMENKGKETPLFLALLHNSIMASRCLRELLEQEGKAKILMKENRRHGKIFRQAAEEGDLNTVKFFLAAPYYLPLSRLEKKRCTNHGSADENGTTPLHLAASNGHFMIVKAILSSEARVDVENKEKETPLYLASQKGHKQIVNLLLHDSADPFHGTLNKEKTAIDIAASRSHWDCVECMLNSTHKLPRSLNFHKLIIEGGVDPNIVDEWGCTLLKKAIVTENVELVHCLMQCNVLPDPRDKYDGETPLHVACFHGCNDIVRALIEHGASVNTRNKRSHTPLYISVSRTKIEITETLLEYNADVNVNCGHCVDTVLHLAVDKCMERVCRLLLDWGADVSAKDFEGNTPLHRAAHVGNMELLRLLLKKGANVNEKNVRGDTPLHWAARAGDMDFLGLLLNRGANVNATNESGDTPIHFCASEEIKYLLLSEGADSNMGNDDGLMPLDAYV